MPFEITKEFTFEAAHSLTTVPVGHQCSDKYADGSPRVHGHSYTLILTLRSGGLDHRGFVEDYGFISSVVKPFIVDWLDHHNLNVRLAMFTNEPFVTSAENIARLLYHHFREEFPGLWSVTVKETASSSATYWSE